MLLEGVTAAINSTELGRPQAPMSTDNPRYSTDCGSPNEDKGAYRNILGEVGGRTERKMHHDSLSTSLSFAGKCV